MRRAAVLGLPALVAVLLMSGCASTAPTVADVAASPTGSTTSLSVVSGSISSSQTSAAQRCDPAADGSAGVPTDRSEPVVTVRFFSTWGQILAPVVVLYRDGTVAVAATYRQGGSDPLLPFSGGEFSACAVELLEQKFEKFGSADVGEAAVADAGEALIERFDATGMRISALHINGFGIDDGTQGLTAVQQRARAEAQAWFKALTRLRNGVSLGLDRIGVAHNIGLNSGLGEDLAPVIWPKSAALTGSCTILTGTAAQDVRSAVLKSAAKSERARSSGSSYSAWFRFPVRKSKIDVMVFPPAAPCLPLDFS